jgi:hypothetical protein
MEFLAKRQPTHLVAHLYFFQPHKANQKNPKEPPSQRTTTADNNDRQEGQHITAVWRNGG